MLDRSEINYLSLVKQRYLSCDQAKQAEIAYAYYKDIDTNSIQTVTTVGLQRGSSSTEETCRHKLHKKNQRMYIAINSTRMKAIALILNKTLPTAILSYVYSWKVIMVV